MRFSALFQRRVQWLNLPSALLMLLLQRSPVATLVAVTDEIIAAAPLGQVMKSALAAAAALGAVNTVVGATPLVPSSGTATNLSVTTSTAVSVFYTVNGTQTPPMSWSVTGDFPPGLSFSGLTSDGGVNVGSLHLSGTPTQAGNYAVTIRAWQLINQGGVGSPSYNYTIAVTGANTATAPGITTQPSNQTVTVGDSVSFTVAASGNPSPTFQWRKDGNDIAGATSATFAIASAAAGDAGTYTAVATNSAGTATSNGATLTVNAATAAPTFTTQPASQTVTTGAAVTFTAAASGNPTPTFQWRKDGNDIAGATSATFTISSAAAGDAGTYTAVATNSAGTATSNGATLTVNAATAAPTFTTQPASQTVTTGAAVTFTAAASGNPTPTFQWRKDGNDIAGATNATFAIASAAAGDAGTYTAVATNSAGAATSNGATLTVSAAQVAPEITQSPSSVIVALGGNATFTVVATGNPAPTYQWRKNAVDIAGATNATLTIANVAVGDAAHYAVAVTNALGTVISGSATLTVATTAARPIQSVTATTGHSATFSAGTGSGSVQWQLSLNGGTTWTDLANDGTYSGATTRALTVNNVSTSQNGAQYRYVVSDNGVIATSNAATLTVAPVIFPFPTGVAVDGGGVLYVSDANTDTIQKVSTANQVSLLAGTSGSAGTADGTGTAARFNQPGGVTLLASGTLIVADTANATLRSIDTNGAVTTLAGASGTRGNTDGTGTAATFSSPFGLGYDAAGVLFVADAMNHTVRKIATGGVVTTLAGTAGAQGTADGAGAAARFNLPNGLAVDAGGNVFVADTTNNTVRRITGTGDVVTLAGLPGVSGFDDGTGIRALFNRPLGLATDGQGNVYVADTGNSTIRKVTSAGAVTTIAGVAGVAGLEDGTGSAALFNQPQALALDAAGNIYVADTGNAAIRKITPAGVVTTLTLSLAPAPAPAPTPTPQPNPPPMPSTGGGGGGGGGAPTVWLPLGLLVLLALRRRRV